MNVRSIGILATGASVLVGLMLFWTPTARSQINASPSWIPIGVSASGTTSTAWFHEPSSRQALACQTVAAQGSGVPGIHCVTTKLP
jgi:hypothetical protein